MENSKRRRRTDIKPCRISILATMGCLSILATMGRVTPEITGKLPGYLSPSVGKKFADTGHGLRAISKVSSLSWAQMIAHAGCCEPSQAQPESTAAAEGDSGFEVLTRSDLAELKKKLSVDIVDGGLATMQLIVGMFFPDGLTGSARGDWARYAEEEEDENENCKRRRQIEMKLVCISMLATMGRLSILATMGRITHETTGKLPGYLSPSAGMKFADTGYGLGAISKVPSLGWAQMTAHAGLSELSQAQSAGTAATEGDFGFKVLTSSDLAELEKKLSVEIANGNLAIALIIDMLFLDGLTGSAWGDWARSSASPFRVFETKCILATMGRITPEVIGKLPGYLSPSAGMKFADTRYGLGAISKVPSLGWAQMTAHAGLSELSQAQSAGTAATEGDFGFKVLTSSDLAELKKLPVDIANGNLAIAVIIGMLFLDGLTSTAW